MVEYMKRAGKLPSYSTSSNVFPEDFLEGQTLNNCVHECDRYQEGKRSMVNDTNQFNDPFLTYHGTRRVLTGREF